MTKQLIENKQEQLTPTMLRLLPVMLDPECAGLPVAEKCRRADISRDCYYRIIKDERLALRIKKSATELVMGRVGDIINASINCAVNSGPRGFADRKMLLEMAGVVAIDLLDPARDQTPGIERVVSLTLKRTEFTPKVDI